MNNNFNNNNNVNQHRNDDIKLDTAVNIKKATTKKVIVKSARVTGFCISKIFQWILNTILTLLLIFTICGIIIGTTFATYVKNELIDEDFDIIGLEKSLDSTTKIYIRDENGSYVELEEERLYGSENRVWVSYTKMPKNLINAFVAIEDERYFEHGGVDWKRTFGAAINFATGNDNYGGSTITQQLIKNYTGEDDTTIQRKITEIFRALTITEKYSKETVLEMYLNRIHLSRNNYGVQAAANYYFGCDVSELSLTQCACLAAIPKSPTKYDPVRNPDNNKERRDVVLDKMCQLGYITKDECEEAKNADLGMNITIEDIEEQITEPYSYFKDALIDQIIEDLQREKGMDRLAASDLVFSGGLEIYSTMDPYVQDIMEEFYEDMSNYQDIPGEEPPQSAMVIMDPYTGEVLGLVGGRGEKTGRRELNRATHSLRQVGSSIKPLTVYAPAMDRGIISYSSVYDDYPTTIMGRYWPTNSPNTFQGKININDAVVRSKNTVAVKVMLDMGVDEAYDFAKNTLHFDTLDEEKDNSVAVLALGGFTYGVSVLDMTAAYCMFPNGGDYMVPHLYTKVLNPDGTVLLEYTPKEVAQPAISKSTAVVMTKILQNVVSYGTAASLTIDQKVNTAGKTGTTNDSKDLYFAGYTPYYVGCVWFGYDQPKNLLRFTGYSGKNRNPAMKAWETVMLKVHQRHFDDAANGVEPLKTFDLSGLTTGSYCLDSGLIPCALCSNDVRGSRVGTAYYYGNTGKPTRSCSTHVSVDFCTESKSIASPYCPDESVTQVSFIYENERKLPFGNRVIADSIYTFRNTDLSKAPAGVIPFYVDKIPAGYHVGEYNVDEGKAANRICPLHTEEFMKEQEEKAEEAANEETETGTENEEGNIADNIESADSDVTDGTDINVEGNTNADDGFEIIDGATDDSETTDDVASDNTNDNTSNDASVTEDTTGSDNVADEVTHNPPAEDVIIPEQTEQPIEVITPPQEESTEASTEIESIPVAEETTVNADLSEIISLSER